MRMLPAQRAFTAGELTPKIHSQADIEGYAKGLATCSNAIAERHGSVVSRHGTRLVSSYEASGLSWGRLFSFQIDEYEAFTVAILDNGKMYVDHRQGNQWQRTLGNGTSQGQLILENGGAYSYYGYSKIVMAAGGTTASDYCEIQGGSYPDGIKYRFRLKAKPLVEGHAKTDHTTSLKLLLGDSPGSSNMFSLDFPKGETEVDFIIPAQNDPVYPTLRVTGDGASEAPIWEIEYYEFAADSVISATSTVELDHPWDAEDIYAMQAVEVPGEDKIWFLSPYTLPHELVRTAGGNDVMRADTLQPVDFDYRPQEWVGYADFSASDGSQTVKVGYVVNLDIAAGGGTVGNYYRFVGTAGTIDLSTQDYSVTANWTSLGTTSNNTSFANLNMPGACCFYQGRAWFSAFKNQPDKIWASKSADYRSLDLGTSQDDEALNVTLVERAIIRWLYSGQDLLVGSAQGEYVITSSGGVITPSDIQVQKQSANGSTVMQGKPVSNSVIYIANGGAKVRDMEYKFVVNGWQSRDMSYTAEHMFREYGHAREIHYAQDPDSIIWMVTDRGKLIGCTFDPANNVIGWHHHEVDGIVLSACVVNFHGHDELNLLVKRPYVDDSVYLERMDPGATMDCMSVKVYASGTDSRTISEPTLAGQTVKVVADQVVESDITLNASGVGTRASDASLVKVGIGFTSTIKTLPQHDRTQQGANVIQQKAWSRIVARVEDSAIPTSVNGEVPVLLDGVTEDYSNGTTVLTDRVSGLISSRAGGYSLDAPIEIIHSDPTKFRMTGLFGVLTVEGAE